MGLRLQQEEAGVISSERHPRAHGSQTQVSAGARQLMSASEQAGVRLNRAGG